MSDASISDALAQGLPEDLSQPWTADTHQAARVAAIVRLLDQGVAVPPLALELAGRQAHLHDGHHRLRAYQYLRRLYAVPVDVTIR